MAATTKRRILIADDDRDWTDMLAAALEDEGYAVRTAHDGFEALDAATDFEPQIVTLDLRMPRMGGHAAARVLSARPPGLRPVLIAITGMAGEEGRHYAQSIGIDHYLAKPARLADIIELLKRV